MNPPRALRYVEARARVLDRAHPLPAVSVPLSGCRWRALREAVVAPHSLPPFRNSAMDGFAVRARDLAQASAAAPVTLRVVAVIPAGKPSERSLAAGEAARIMTGAMLPAGADAVVPFEESERAGTGATERCIVARPSRTGDHVRDAGADVFSGSLVLEPGRELSAHDLALVAALGRPRLEVGPKPRVAVLSTGDELLDVDQPLRPGAIRDSNLPMMRMLLEAAGAEVAGARRLPDDAGRVASAIRESLESCDVVLTLGGVSEGDRDPVRAAIGSLPEVESWRVAMRPGRPQAFGAPRGKLVFGLPGNPASVACVFEALVRPALRALQGHAHLDRPRVPVKAAAAVDSRAGRTDFVRATLAWRDGELWASPAGSQLSGHLSPQSRAHALLVVPEEAERLAAGDPAEALVLRMPDA
jgi:molybdenum cofactor synthesis domain-containing protein